MGKEPESVLCVISYSWELDASWQWRGGRNYAAVDVVESKTARYEKPAAAECIDRTGRATSAATGSQQRRTTGSQ